jgi:hypothetical protein
VNVLQDLYPEYNWKILQFHAQAVRHDFWNDLHNQRHFLLAVAKELNVNTLNDWYKVSGAELSNRIGRAFLLHYGGSLAAALKTLFPDYTWYIWNFQHVCTAACTHFIECT